MENQQGQSAGDRHPEIRLKVTAESLSFFTTLLQSGIEIETPAGTPLGSFLCHCPGFFEEYLSETVQTIFLDGIALDDLRTPLSDGHPVVALSAAMPGLAGAIFRKNSLHAALRTATAAPPSGPRPQESLTVTLKLFNRIAREKGERLLFLGAVIARASGPLSTFLTNRHALMDHIKSATINSKPVPPEDLPRLIRDYQSVTLFVSAEE